MKKLSLFTITTFLFLSLSTIGQELQKPFLIEEEIIISSDRDGELDCPVNSIFSQSPIGSTSAFPSDEGSAFNDQNMFDLFYGLNEDIVGITFWGALIGTECTSGPLNFEISFYQDNAGTIGSLVQSFIVSVTPTTASSFLRFDVNFPSSVSLASGWVSVVRQNPGDVDCTFAWVNTTNGDDVFGYTLNGGPYGYGTDNVSFCLTGSPPVPVSNWAIYFGIFLIGLFVIFRFRRRLA